MSLLTKRKRTLAHLGISLPQDNEQPRVEPAQPGQPPPIPPAQTFVDLEPTPPEALVAATPVFDQPSDARTLSVGVIGAPNAGKSTLINALVGKKVSIVSQKVQTTRSRILGVSTEGSTQLYLVDTPGMVGKDKARLMQDLVKASASTIDEAEMLMVVMDLAKNFGKDEAEVLTRVKNVDQPTVLVLNKRDLLIKGTEERRIQIFEDKVKSNVPKLERVFVTAARFDKGTEDLKAYLMSRAMPGQWLFAPTVDTDMPPATMVEEAIREQLFRRIHHEVPYQIKQRNVGWTTLPSGVLRIDQDILIPRESLKRMVIGDKGKTIKHIREEAEKFLRAVMKKPVQLMLSVRTKRQSR